MSKTVVRRQPSHALALAMMLGMGAAVAVATAEGQQAETAPSYSQLLENAIFTEETLGNLDAAIEIYQRIVAQQEDQQQCCGRVPQFETIDHPARIGTGRRPNLARAYGMRPRR